MGRRSKNKRSQSDKAAAVGDKSNCKWATLKMGADKWRSLDHLCCKFQNKYITNFGRDPSKPIITFPKYPQIYALNILYLSMTQNLNFPSRNFFLKPTNEICIAPNESNNRIVRESANIYVFICRVYTQLALPFIALQSVAQIVYTLRLEMSPGLN